MAERSKHVTRTQRLREISEAEPFTFVMSRWWWLIVERDEFERGRGREGGRERGAVSLVTVDMHKGLNGNRAETRRNQTAS